MAYGDLIKLEDPGIIGWANTTQAKLLQVIADLTTEASTRAAADLAAGADYVAKINAEQTRALAAEAAEAQARATAVSTEAAARLAADTTNATAAANAQAAAAAEVTARQTAVAANAAADLADSQAAAAATAAEQTRAQLAEGNVASAAQTALTSALATRDAMISANATAIALKIDMTAAVASFRPLLDLLATVTAATALTAGKVRPADATAGALTMTALPALSGLALGTTYAFEKIDTSTNAVTVPFAAGDTTLIGSTSASLTTRGTIELQVSTNPAGGKVWRVTNHVRSDASIMALLDPRYLNALGTPSNPVTNAAAARPTGLTVVYWQTSTQPTNWVAGDHWDQV